MKAAPQGQTICHYCGSGPVMTTDSRVLANNWRKRRKLCVACHRRWNTIEVPEELLDSIHTVHNLLRSMNTHVSAIENILEHSRHLAMIEEGNGKSNTQTTYQLDWLKDKYNG